ncbi:MAG: peptidylprolyl isomerase [Bacteroides sp.]|jgi:peptidyl-prolyl cis-trans isomerase SurA|nr:peptidylprolyl isomerase [Bacteroides sp.]
MKKIQLPFLLLFFHIFINLPLSSQDKVVVDQVIAVVGNSAILESDIVNQRRQLEGQGFDLGSNPDCAILDDMLFQKLLYNQAILDSLEVSDEQVEQVLERRLRFFISQIGSREKLEAYYGKSVEELKEEFRDIVREQELGQQMEAKITSNVKVTPSEVRSFFNRLPEDSIPMVESELILGQVVKKPPVQPEEIANVKSRLEEFKQRVLNGESFNTLAVLYSEDPGSARRGGELGFFGRGELYPEFEAAAFNLRPGELSDIVETEAGFHIIQMIERRGEQFNVRHILLQPKVSPLDLMAARQELDSIKTLIINGEMTFAEAALKFSDDPGKINQGLMINPYTGTTRFKSEEIEPNLFFVIDQMQVGDISSPIGMVTEEGQQAFRIVQLQSRTEPHRGNLQQDYDYIQQLALEEKKRKATEAWISRRLPNTYVLIHEKFRNCPFELEWLKGE